MASLTYKRAKQSFMASALLGTAIALMPGAVQSQEMPLPEGVSKEEFQEALKKLQMQAQQGQQVLSPEQIKQAQLSKHLRRFDTLLQIMAEAYTGKGGISDEVFPQAVDSMIATVQKHFETVAAFTGEKAKTAEKDTGVSTALAKELVAEMNKVLKENAAKPAGEKHYAFLKALNNKLDEKQFAGVIDMSAVGALPVVAPGKDAADFDQKLNRWTFFANEMNRLKAVVGTLKEKYFTESKVANEKLPDMADAMIHGGKDYLNKIAALKGEEAAFAESEEGLSTAKTKELIAVYEGALRANRSANADDKLFAVLKVLDKNLTQKQFTSILNVMINNMLASLDPHSSYFKSSLSNTFIDGMKGEFGGLGIEIIKNQDNNIVVKGILSKGPTGKMRAAGLPSLQTDDVITHITVKEGPENKPVTYETAKLGQQDAVGKMKGLVGTDVTLTVARPGVKDPLNFTITRGKVEISMVKAAELLDDNVAYIRVSDFGFKAAKDVEDAIIELQKKAGGKDNVKGYILDLVNNPGGEMGVATSVVDHFISENTEIAVSKKRGGKITDTRKTVVDGDITGGKKLVVLVNGGSASASEVTSGSLKELKRATVIGNRTFGKGSFQTYIEFQNPDGSSDALKATEGLYYFKKSDTSPQNVGVSPHIRTESVVPQSNTLSEAKMDNTIPNPDHERSAAAQPDAEKQCVRADEKKSMETIRAKYDFLLTGREADRVTPGQIPQWTFDIACAHEFLTGKRVNTKVVPVTPKP